MQKSGKILIFLSKPLDKWRKKGYNRQADLRKATKKPTINHGRIRSLKIEQHEEEKKNTEKCEDLVSELWKKKLKQK